MMIINDDTQVSADYTVDAVQYWWGTSPDNVTGIGMNGAEAIRDALECAAQCGICISQVVENELLADVPDISACTGCDNVSQFNGPSDDCDGCETQVYCVLSFAETA